MAEQDTPTIPADEQHEGDTPEQPADQPNGAGASLTDEQLAERLAAQSSGLKDVSAEEPRAGATAVTAARDGRRLSDGEKSSALDWFLNEDPAGADETKKLELNFGTEEEPSWVDWVIKPVPMEVMRAIRRKAANTRLARTTGEVDEYRVNLEIVVEGTIDPDIREAARIFGEENRGPADPVDALRAKFQNKPGYIAQIAGKIMTLSGFNDEDVREAERAAKN